MSITLIGSILAAVLTLMVFSYLLGNNPLYRLAQHIFVGVRWATPPCCCWAMSWCRNSLRGPTRQARRGWLVGADPLLAGRAAVPGLLGRRTPAGPGLPASLGTIALNIALSTAAALASAAR